MREWGNVNKFNFIVKMFISKWKNKSMLFTVAENSGPFQRLHFWPLFRAIFFHNPTVGFRLTMIHLKTDVRLLIHNENTSLMNRIRTFIYCVEIYSNIWSHVFNIAFMSPFFFCFLFLQRTTVGILYCAKKWTKYCNGFE